MNGFDDAATTGKFRYPVARHARRVKDAPSGHWVYRVLPQSLWPYAQLARWDRPIGWQLLLWPCWWSAALVAGAGARPGDGAWSVMPSLWHLVLFLIGAIAMRGAGCTYNDLVDQDIDDQVDRTRSRPLPSGQVTRRQARLFLVLQALVGLAVVLQFNWFSIGLGIFSLLIVAAYPFMKRITDWPQFVLGLAFSWGALMGWAAVEGSLSLAPVLLYIGAILWTIGYDTIYAHQDKEDDALVGVRSTARLFGKHTKTALMVLYGGAIGFSRRLSPWRRCRCPRLPACSRRVCIFIARSPCSTSIIRTSACGSSSPTISLAGWSFSASCWAASGSRSSRLSNDPAPRDEARGQFSTVTDRAVPCSSRLPVPDA